MIRATMIMCLTLLLLTGVHALAQPKQDHPKKVYVTPQGRLYLPHGADIYLRLALSPANNAESFLLLNKATLDKGGAPQPFHYEGHGEHSLLHPRKNWNEQSSKIPALTDVFLVNVDAIAPDTKASATEARHVVNNRRTIFGKPVTLSLVTSDADSGVDQTYYSIDSRPFAPYRSGLDFSIDSNFTVSFYAVDNVGNAAKVVKKLYAIDLTPPTTTHSIERYVLRDILSPRAVIDIQSRDVKAGVAVVYQKIDGSKDTKYVMGKPLKVDKLEEGDHVLVYHATDRVGNAESSTTYRFYLDRTPPKVVHAIQGDQHKGDRLYVSERTRFQMTATDNKAGVKETRYKLNGKKSVLYTSPFGLSKRKRDHTIVYFAFDGVENRSDMTEFKVTLDVKPPQADLKFGGEHYFNRSIHYVTSATDIGLTVKDDLSGVQSYNFVLDRIALAAMTQTFRIDKEGAHDLVYFATDNVNNRTPDHPAKIFVDNTAPEIFAHFSVASIGAPARADGSGGAYPLKTLLYLAATDLHAGVREITYKINKDKANKYEKAIRLTEPGQYTVAVTSVDNVGNTSRRSIKFDIRAE
ncbi:MAG: hypothetical protein IID61_01875 [SAR324 cluster bacterium]|nr:hypothetical protein [SAR324 cluster bacterium]